METGLFFIAVLMFFAVGFALRRYSFMGYVNTLLVLGVLAISFKFIGSSKKISK
jgi:hypothetical protein